VSKAGKKLSGDEEEGRERAWRKVRKVTDIE